VRSLADDLRSRSDDELAALLRARPDLAHPVPADLGALAQRAASLPSVGARLRAYDEVQLQVLLLCALAEEPLKVALVTSGLVDAAAGSLTATEARRVVRDSIELFRRDALVWGPPQAPHVVGAVRELLVPLATGPLVAGIDPVVAGYVRDPESLSALMRQMPPAARGALDRLLERPVVGIVVNPRRTPDAARSGVDWLLAHHLVVPFGADRVVVAGEVAQLVTGPRATARQRVPELVAPRPARRIPDPVRAESGAVGTLIDVLHGVDEVGQLWAEEPPSRLRAGGVSSRDITRTARSTGMSESQTCLLLEIAASSGLLANDNREASTVLPTMAFDAWRAQPPAARMAQLLVAWRDMPREVGTAIGDTARPLSDELLAPHLPTLRSDVLAALAREDGDWSQAELLAALRWRAPRLDWEAREPDVLDVLAQLRALGVLVGGWLTSVGHALVEHPESDPPQPPGDAGRRSRGRSADSLEGIRDALARVLPAEVDAVIMQGDLTAVVPGLPSSGLADLLRRVGRVESRGAASVYRFSADSVRAALDRGATAAELLAELGRFGPVPQPLSYLINDTARTHAALRVGAASTYLRCEDAAILAAILADPRTAGLGLFALSDTVAASGQPPEQVLDQLRAIGHHPVPDPGRGLTLAAVRRARGRPTSEPPGSTMPAALTTAAVRVLRAGDQDAAEPPSPGSGDGAGGRGSSRTGHQDVGRFGASARSTLEQLTEELARAIDEQRPVLLDYASASGRSSTVHVQPLELARGYLTGLDLLSQSIETYSLARIRSLQPIDALG
jgi:hypothetical protein